jgi:hypothetical protein
MSDESFGFAPPPFDAAAALQRLKRELLELGLQEREGVFERRGLAIARFGLDGTRLVAARVKRPARTGPDWLSRELTSTADTRDFAADLKRALAIWSDRDD